MKDSRLVVVGLVGLEPPVALFVRCGGDSRSDLIGLYCFYGPIKTYAYILPILRKWTRSTSSRSFTPTSDEKPSLDLLAWHIIFAPC